MNSEMQPPDAMTDAELEAVVAGKDYKDGVWTMSKFRQHLHNAWARRTEHVVLTRQTAKS